MEKGQNSSSTDALSSIMQTFNTKLTDSAVGPLSFVEQKALVSLKKKDELEV